MQIRRIIILQKGGRPGSEYDVYDNQDQADKLHLSDVVLKSCRPANIFYTVLNLNERAQTLDGCK